MRLSFLGIDIGTTGVRGCLIDADGEILVMHSVLLPTAHGEGVECEQSPTVWWGAVREILATLSPMAPELAAIAVDGTSGTVLLTRQSGEPIGAALMYNDGRAVAEAASIHDKAPVNSGAHGAQSGLAKLLWLLRHRGNAGEAAHVLSQADWIAGRLVGRYGFSDENNALKLGHDSLAQRWPDWMDALGIPRSLLPAVYPPGTVIGRLSAAIAAEFGLPAETLIATGTTDSIAAFLATGASEIGEAATALGSTLALKVVSDRPVFSPEHGVYSHRLFGRWLAGGASNSGGAAIARFFTPEEIEHLTSRLHPERPTGFDYHPLPGRGERFPIANPAMVSQTSPRPDDDAEFLQGLFEGVARIEAEGYRLLHELGAPWPSRVFTTGGGARNPVWTAIRSRVLGVPVHTAARAEAAYGAALLARRSCASGN